MRTSDKGKKSVKRIIRVQFLLVVTDRFVTEHEI